MVLKEEDFVVVAEFKFSKINPKTNMPVISYEKMLKTVMDQIKDKKYYKKYLDKKIIAIAIAFTRKKLQTQMYNCKINKKKLLQEKNYKHKCIAVKLIKKSFCRKKTTNTNV